jgi:hypothetical protein
MIGSTLSVLGRSSRISYRGLSTSARNCYRRRGDGTIYRKIFPYLNHPDGSLNHFGIQQNILIVTISTFTILSIAEYFKEPEIEEMGEETKPVSIFEATIKKILVSDDS